MEELLGFLKPLIEIYGGNVGWLAQVIAIVGSLRLFVKPIMSVLEAYVLFTPNKEDDAKFKELESGNVMKSIYYCLDYFASIKIKPKSKK